MIAHLTGLIGRGAPGELTVDVQGVGYRVYVPMQTWESVQESALTTLHTSSYIREDRFDLYGFSDAGTRMLFERFIDLSGIGPRLGLELCDVPRPLLLKAIADNDPRLLASIKGVGKKTAEKLLIELKNLAEKEPLALRTSTDSPVSAQYDSDAVAALTQLGFGTNDVLRTLEQIPSEINTTEARVEAALRML